MDINLKPQSEFITAGVLRSIFTSYTEEFSIDVTNKLNIVCPRYQKDGLHLTDKSIFEDFLARCGVECCNVYAKTNREFGSLAENLNYSAEGLHKVWPNRFPTIDSAVPYAHNPEKIANKVYANRMGNGDEASGDGFMFRGGGGLGMTGRDMYTRYGHTRGVDAITCAKLVQTDLEWAIDSAAWIFCIDKSLMDEAAANDEKTINKRINGAMLGYDDYQNYLKRIRLNWV